METSREHTCDGRALAALAAAAALVALALPRDALAGAVVLDPRVEYHELAGSLEVLHDPSGHLSLDEARAARFGPRTGRAELALRGGALWVRFSLVNPSDEPTTWFVTFDDPLVSRLDVWVDFPGTTLRRQGGLEVPSAERTIELHGPWNELPVVLLPDEQVTVLARMEASGPVFARACVHENSQLGRRLLRRIAQQVIHLGILLALASLNLYSWFALRDRSYLAFLGLILAFAGFEVSETGLGPSFLWPDAPWFSLRAPALFAGLAMHSGLRFADAFLGTQPTRRRRAIAWLPVAASALALVGPRAGNVAVAAAAAVAIPAVALRVIEALRSGTRAGRFFALALGPLVLAAVAYGLTAAGVIPETAPGRHLLHVAFSAAGFVVAFALADRVRSSDLVARARLEHAVEERTVQLATSVEALRREAEDRRRAEDARRASEDKLRHAQRIEAVGRLAGGIAHDYNNLLTSVSTNVSLLLMHDEPPPYERREILADIRDATDRGAALTRQLLAFSRRQVLERQPLSANRAVEGIRRLLGRLVGENFELRLELGEHLPQVVADPGQLEQVLMNLVLNARDAMPSGGRITVRTDLVEVPADAPPVPGAAPGRYVRISVGDTGYGIAPEVATHIFEPFFTTKPEGKGTGLGLATVHGIVSQHGGFVDVDPGPGRGAVFRVHLPVAEASAVAVASRGDAAAELPRGDETVLVVEDDAVVRESTRRLLAHLGYSVLSAQDAADALRDCQRERVDLVLTDVVMPGMDGIALAERVRQSCPRAAVLLTSGHAHDALAAHERIGTELPFLAKPYSAAVLAAKIRAVLDGGRDGPHTREGARALR